jgi:hypothetical protein
VLWPPLGVIQRILAGAILTTRELRKPQFTHHAERLNLTVSMSMKRFARLKFSTKVPLKVGIPIQGDARRNIVNSRADFQSMSTF